MAQHDCDVAHAYRVHVLMRTISNSRCPFDTLGMIANDLTERHATGSNLLVLPNAVVYFSACTPY